MGFFDWFRRSGSPPPSRAGDAPLVDLRLTDLRAGYLVDYDLQTWEVVATFRYDFGDGDTAQEWELRSGSETRFLEHEPETDGWTLSRRIPMNALRGTGRETVARHIVGHDDPPETIYYQDRRYDLEDSGAGYLVADTGERTGFVFWTFNTRDDAFVTIEQWGERDFEASAGEPIPTFAFTNLLPSGA